MATKTVSQAIKNTENKATKETKKATKTVQKVENREKKDQVVTISMNEVVKLYKEFGIKEYNPEAKGNYRIMGTKKGSSLNLQKRKYIIFSTEDDFAAVEKVGNKYKDLVLVKGGNSQDKSRPNKVEFTALETLKALLAIYAKNPVNQVVATK